MIAAVCSHNWSPRALTQRSHSSCRRTRSKSATRSLSSCRNSPDCSDSMSCWYSSINSFSVLSDQSRNTANSRASYPHQPPLCCSTSWPRSRARFSRSGLRSQCVSFTRAVISRCRSGCGAGVPTWSNSLTDALFQRGQKCREFVHRVNRDFLLRCQRAQTPQIDECDECDEDYFFLETQRGCDTRMNKHVFCVVQHCTLHVCAD